MCALKEIVGPYPVCVDHAEILAIVCKGFLFPFLFQWHIVRLPDKSSLTGRIVQDMTVLYVCLSKMLGTKEINNVSLLGSYEYWINHKMHVKSSAFLHPGCSGDALEPGNM